MGNFCVKPKVNEENANPEEVRERAILILHAYQDLPNDAKGHHATRKRRGSFVLFEQEVPCTKRIRTNDMIAYLEKYLVSHKDDENEAEKDKN